MDVALGTLIIIIVLLGFGATAWHVLVRRLKACEDRVNQLLAEREALQRSLARWPPIEGADER